VSETAPTVVAGAGPAGVAAAFVLARAGLPVVLLDSGDTLGGKVRTLSDGGRRFEHGVHGWWPCYANFDRLLDWAGIDVATALRTADDIRMVVEDGRQVPLRPLRRPVPSPFFMLWQALRTPIVGVRDALSLFRFSIHLLAFDPATDYAAYSPLTFEAFLDYAGVSAKAKILLFNSFTKTFCYAHLEDVSAACALSALRAYVLPSDERCVPRWLTGLSQDILFGPIGTKLADLGVTVLPNVIADALVLGDGHVEVVVSGPEGALPASLDVHTDDTLVVGSVDRAQVDGAPGGLAVDVGDLPVTVRAAPAGGYEALVRRCTHAGCEVAYDTTARVFACPCHGGLFDTEGVPTGGPPVRPLDRLAVRAADGSLRLERARARLRIEAHHVILATDALAARDVVANTVGIPESVHHDLGHLTATSVIVVRFWFSGDIAVDDKPQGALTPTLPMVDAYFCLSKILPAAQRSSEHEVEIQVAGAKQHYLDLPDATLVALALEDLAVVSPDYRADRVVDSRVLRHRDVFTTFPAAPRSFELPAELFESVHAAGDWTVRPGNSWMMERAVVSGLDRANHILEEHGIPPVEILSPQREGFVLRVMSKLAFLMRSILRGGFTVPPRLTEKQMIAHDRVDHVINGWACLIVGSFNLLPAFDDEFNVLLKAWPVAFIAMNVYFFLHVEPWVRVQYGSWFRSLADPHTFQHRLMTGGGAAVGGVELALAQGWLHGDLWRALFPVGTVIFGVLFTLHHWGEDPLADRQHRDIGFLSMIIGVTMGAARFFDSADGMAFVWPVLFLCQAYFFISYMATTLHGHTAEPGSDGHGAHAH